MDDDESVYFWYILYSPNCCICRPSTFFCLVPLTSISRVLWLCWTNESPHLISIIQCTECDWSMKLNSLGHLFNCIFQIKGLTNYQNVIETVVLWMHHYWYLIMNFSKGWILIVEYGQLDMLNLDDREWTDQNIQSGFGQLTMVNINH